MAVIGRLDGQVDEVIIKPISERRRGEEPPAPDEGAPQPPTPPETQTPTPNQSSDKPDTLPVWLL
ncbi:MAG TPA: hypothetical protein VM936_04675 [Pyrinomonadaceae bacterium]|nr:hypothetical protein [Pyrinomonadaceae bacterium]